MQLDPAERDALEQEFLHEIADAPADDDLRMAYADFLEEILDVRGEWLRCVCQWKALSPDDPAREAIRLRIAELSPRIALSWRAQTIDLPIENCPGAVWNEETRRATCPLSWLAQTSRVSPTVSLCGACRLGVRFCGTIGEAQNVVHPRGAGADRVGAAPVVVDPSQARGPSDIPSKPGDPEIVAKAAALANLAPDAIERLLAANQAASSRLESRDKPSWLGRLLGW